MPVCACVAEREGGRERVKRERVKRERVKREREREREK